MMCFFQRMCFYHALYLYYFNVYLQRWFSLDISWIISFIEVNVVNFFLYHSICLDFIPVWLTYITKYDTVTFIILEKSLIFHNVQYLLHSQ